MEVDFSPLNLKISPNVKNYPIETQREIFNYLSGLDELNRKAYQIAYDHLGTSFNVARSNGFKLWKMAMDFITQADDNTKELFNYTGGYSIDYEEIVDSDLFKKWLKSRK